MSKGLLARLARAYAMRTGKGRGAFTRFCRPSGEEWAEYLRRHGGLAHLGEGCSILPDTNITDPYLTHIGNNVHTSSCAMIAHNGAVAMFQRAYGVRLDAVGKIVIKDNVFIGYQAIILGNVTIGPNVVIGAGAVVVHDVAEGDIVAGVPARSVGRVKDYVDKLDKLTESYPWGDIIRERAGGFDPAVEPTLQQMRTKYFFPGG